MSSSKKYPWDLILKLVKEEKDIPERLLDGVAGKMKGYFQKSAPKEKNQTFILNDKDALHSYNNFMKECIAATKKQEKYHKICLKLIPISIDAIQLENVAIEGMIVPYLQTLNYYKDKYKSKTNSIEGKETIDDLKEVFQTLKDIFEQYTLPELYYAHLYELYQIAPNYNTDFHTQKSMNFVFLYKDFHRYLDDYEKLLIILDEDYEEQQKLAKLAEAALLAEDEAKKLAEKAAAAEAAYKAAIKQEAAAAEAAVAAAKIVNTIAAAGNTGSTEAAEEAAREAVRQAQIKANIEASRQDYLRRLPNYVPRTDESNWQRITAKISTPTGKQYKADYHEEGICEGNFETLADKLTEHIQIRHYYSAFLQLERCIQERRKVFHEKGNANEKHESILRGLEHLLQRMKEAPIDKIKTIKFVGKFFRITNIDDTYKDIQIYRGGKRQTRKQKKRNRRKTRKH
jgi:hypothetical protein